MIKIEVLLDKKTKYGDIFPIADKDNVNKLYKDYCKAFHPDANCHANATDAFANLQILYKEATKALEGGMWEGTNYLYIKTSTSGLSIPYLYHCVFELGEYYVTKSYMVYIFEKSKNLYYNNYIKRVKEIKYADDKMKMFANFIPNIYKEFDTDNKHIIVIHKPEDTYPLRCFVENYFNNEVPNKHLAWMVTRLLNLCCFLKYNNLVSNGINIDNLFVCPEQHSICLYGGWWYTQPIGGKMNGTTGEIFNIMLPKTKADRVADAATDIESVKLIARKLSSKTIERPLSDYFSLGSTSDAYKELAKWDDVLKNAFGERKFIKLDNINNNTLYKKG